MEKKGILEKVQNGTYKFSESIGGNTFFLNFPQTVDINTVHQKGIQVSITDDYDITGVSIKGPGKTCPTCNGTGKVKN